MAFVIVFPAWVSLPFFHGYLYFRLYRHLLLSVFLYTGSRSTDACPVIKGNPKASGEALATGAGPLPEAFGKSCDQLTLHLQINLVHRPSLVLAKSVGPGKVLPG